MDRKTWALLRSTVRKAARQMDRELGRPRRACRYGDALIVTMYLYAVKRNVAQSQACKPEHYRDGPWRVRQPLPSVSQFNRRMRSGRCQWLLERVNRLTAASDSSAATQLLCLDSKALPVGLHSRDPDARTSHVGAGWVRGYKLHAAIGQDRKIKVFAVTPMNGAEQTVACQMMLHPSWPPPAGSLVLGDGSYDSRHLYHLAAACGAYLLTPLKGKSQKPGRLREMGAARREAVRVWQRTPHLARYVLRERIRIEQVFSALCCSSEGLCGLPGFVRRLERVRRWVGAKIIWYNTALEATQRPFQRLAA